MRERLRERRREREARLLDLGALVYELHRQGKRAPELLQNKAAELAVIDSEVRDLEAALAGEPAAELVGESEPEGETYEADALDHDELHDEGERLHEEGEPLDDEDEAVEHDEERPQ